MTEFRPQSSRKAPAVASRRDQQRIIVTGGAGFLGSQLCRALIEQGHRVIAIDNLLSGRLENLSDLLGCPRFDFILHDIIEPLPIQTPIDQIYNLACPASPPVYQRDPLHTFKSSVLGGMNMLEIARSKRARILQASTSEIYGDPKISPQPESYCGNVNTCGPRACYDEGKRAAETLFHDYNDRFGVETRIARIFNTYGPGMSPEDGRVVSNLIVQALSGVAMTVNGDGTQTRSFCYRDDMIDGLIRLMNAPLQRFQAVNLGNPAEVTILELSELVRSKTGTTNPVSYRDLPQHDPLQRRPDISVAKRLLGWAPTVPLERGLDRTIRYFRDQLSQNATARAMAL
ncbi:MAG: SDR family oxidoreductase [Rhodobacter sp.]|nr:SDR family oxidoreductase [Rhodobacter sp.]